MIPEGFVPLNTQQSFRCGATNFYALAANGEQESERWQIDRKEEVGHLSPLSILPLLAVWPTGELAGRFVRLLAVQPFRPSAPAPVGL